MGSIQSVIEISFGTSTPSVAVDNTCCPSSSSSFWSYTEAVSHSKDDGALKLEHVGIPIKVGQQKWNELKNSWNDNWES